MATALAGVTTGTMLLPIELPNGSSIMVEATVTGEDFGDEKFDGMPSLDRIGDAIEGAATVLVTSIRKAEPDKASVELGFEVSGKAGIPVLAQGSAKANVTVTLEWDKEGAKA